MHFLGDAGASTNSGLPVSEAPLFSKKMGSLSFPWRNVCTICQTRRIDPLGFDDISVGHWCGQCDVDWQLTLARVKLCQCLSRHPLVPCLPAVEVIAGFLGGTRTWFKLALRRYLLRFVLEGKAYGFESPLSKISRRCSNLPPRSELGYDDDVLDIILDFACLSAVSGRRCTRITRWNPRYALAEARMYTLALCAAAAAAAGSSSSSSSSSS